MEAPRGPIKIRKDILSKRKALLLAFRTENESIWREARIQALKEYLTRNIELLFRKESPERKQFDLELTEVERQDNVLDSLLELAQNWQIAVNVNRLNDHTLPIFCQKKGIKLE